MTASFLALLLFPAQARPAQGIVGGSETSDFEAVGTLVAVDSRGYGGSFCSGTLVAPTWVVTAAHCVEAIDGEMRGYDIYFATGTDISTQRGIDDLVGLRDWIANPSYNANSGYYDIGLLELDRAVSGASPMPVNSDPVRNSWIGDPVTFVGWGITGDRKNDAGTKRTVDVPLYDYDSKIIYTYSRTGENICSGDSGGAALMPDGEGRWELVGVSVFGFNINGGQPNCEGSGAAAGSTRTDVFWDWVDGYADLGSVETDTDTDSDSDSDTDADTAVPAGWYEDDPGRPDGLGDMPGLFCATSSSSGAGLLAWGLLLAMLRRRPGRGSTGAPGFPGPS